MAASNWKAYRNFLIAIYSVVFAVAFLSVFDLKRNSDNGLGGIMDDYLCGLLCVPCFLSGLLLLPYAISHKTRSIA